MNEIAQFLPLLAKHGWWVIIAVVAYVVVKGEFKFSKGKFKFSYPRDGDK